MGLVWRQTDSEKRQLSWVLKAKWANRMVGADGEAVGWEWILETSSYRCKVKIYKGWASQTCDLYRTSSSESPHTWLKVLLSPSWKSSYFLNRVPCYHFTLDPADYVAGSEYPTVFFPLTLKKKHINSDIWNTYTASSPPDWVNWLKLYSEMKPQL